MKNKASIILFATFILSLCQLYTPFATAGESSIAKWFAQKRQTVDTNFQQNPINSSWQFAKTISGAFAAPFAIKQCNDLYNLQTLSPDKKQLLKNIHKVQGIPKKEHLNVAKLCAEISHQPYETRSTPFYKRDLAFGGYYPAGSYPRDVLVLERYDAEELLSKTKNLNRQSYMLSQENNRLESKLSKVTSLFKINRNLFGLTALFAIAKNGWDKLTNPMKS